MFVQMGLALFLVKREFSRRLAPPVPVAVAG